MESEVSLVNRVGRLSRWMVACGLCFGVAVELAGRFFAAEINARALQRMEAQSPRSGTQSTQ